MQTPKLLLTLIALFMAATATASAQERPNYFCFNPDTQEWVRLIQEDEDTLRFKYGQFDETLISFPTRSEGIRDWGVDRVIMNIFRPPAETQTHVYGRIHEGRGLFDIYQLGMGNDIVTDSNNYDCRTY